MKRKSLLVSLSATVCIALAAISCSKDFESSGNSTRLDLSGNYQYTAGTNELATLGRVLFYDKGLSLNAAVSCASCHKQHLAFADDVAGSRGFQNIRTDRNTPPIQNLFSGGGFFGPTPITPFPRPGFGEQSLFWDGRETILQDMVVQPILNHVEMGMRNSNEVVSRVKDINYYPQLFEDAYGDDEVSFERISEALMVFVQNITTFGSTFEKGIQATEQVQRGLDLFFNTYDCASCHQPFSGNGYNIDTIGQEFVNIGLDVVYADKGRSGVTGNPEDDGKFKIPNLRNIALTAPYMHDGRFQTLEEVMNHYSTGIEASSNLDTRLRDNNGSPMVLNITEQDKRDLIAFLESMTDRSMTTDPKLSNPFK